MRAFCFFGCALVAVLLANEVSGENAFDPTRLEKRVLVNACHDPMQLEVLADGHVLFIERHGAVKRFDPVAKTTETIGLIPAAVFGEVGLMGLACDLNFNNNGWVYLLYCPSENPDTIRLSRFTIAESLDLASEVALFDYPIEKQGAIHMGGGLVMDGRGNLHVGTGDNSPPIPELPVDQRPGRENFDALRSSANSMDLRGKVLRIHPLPDGTYRIPEGNLFGDPTLGRPEIYAMGCRNPFRLSVDAEGCVYWGDVGPNIDLDLQLGPNGYDEINRAPASGNFGWPMFVGNNEAYRDFDFQRRTSGALFDINRPLNRSRNNTGIERLPRPQAALIWYPSGDSKEFPMLGSGGRSAMAGPVYHHRNFTGSKLRLPKELDGQLFIYEWTRNWIRSVRFSEQGELVEIAPFMEDSLFRKPIDMEIGPDGTLYVIEYGDKWGDNHDAQIVQIVYHRGNRNPISEITATPNAGRHPIRVQFDASKSTDPDNDALTFRWEIDGNEQSGWNESTAEYTFERPGTYRVSVIATDPAGTTSKSTAEIRVGNAKPSVAILSPTHGSFFDWEDTIRYRISADDAEDGSTSDDSIASGRVLLNHQFFKRQPGASGAETVDPGLAAMRKTTCFSCHTTKSQSAGPAYREIGRKYAGDPTARERLAEKIVRGGTGVWGNKPMPPHPQHTLQQTRLMVDWVLSLADDTSPEPLPGKHGFFRAETAGPMGQTLPAQRSGVLRLTAEYTDQGAEGAAALRGETQCVLHTRRKRAASFDQQDGVDLVDVFERQVGLVARFEPHSWIAFRDVNLADIDRITWNAAAPEKTRATFSLRIDSPDGPEIARLDLAGKSDPLGELFQSVTTPVTDPGGLHDLFVVNVSPDQREATKGNASQTTSLAWLHFHDSPAAERRKRLEDQQRKKIVLIPTELDHPWATHMYANVCHILAACLNETPGVEAVVSPDLDWPEDDRLLQEADAIVYYSRPAGDIVLSPAHRETTEKLLRRGVGFTAIHWATGAEQDVGQAYRELLGGWFHFDHSGLKVDRQPLEQLLPQHPICRGWNSYQLRDEFYLNLQFSPKAQPVLKVNVEGQDQTVAWVLERSDGGRSFGTTLGHFHENYAYADFRKMLVNGILWTANVDVPESGGPTDVRPDLLELPSQERSMVREWTLADLEPLLNQPLRQRNFNLGAKLFKDVSCAACHTIDGSEGKLGPDLQNVRVRLADQPHPRLALLREMLEPSHRIEEPYRTRAFLLSGGQVVSGIVKAENDATITVASNPTDPSQLTQIQVDDIEAENVSLASMMPTGLLNTLTKDEILDLLAFVESGGQADYVAVRPSPPRLETWANSELPVQHGLALWLDASRMNAARQAANLPPLTDGQMTGHWPDASGEGRDVRQRQLSAQPIFRLTDGGAFVEFDGADDYLSAANVDLSTRGFTAFLVVRINHNRRWPGLISGNTFDRNDFQSGFNIDLMPDPTEQFSSVMVEGPGFIGVTNLMRDVLPFECFHIVTVSSEPGGQSVRLRINGREQGSRDRAEGICQIDELTIGARYWTHDASLPPFNRGFLDGGFSQVLLYDRVLSDSDQIGLESWLWNQNVGLLDRREH